MFKGSLAIIILLRFNTPTLAASSFLGSRYCTYGKLWVQFPLVSDVSVSVSLLIWSMLLLLASLPIKVHQFIC